MVVGGGGGGGLTLNQEDEISSKLKYKINVVDNIAHVYIRESPSIRK